MKHLTFTIHNPTHNNHVIKLLTYLQHQPDKRAKDKDNQTFRNLKILPQADTEHCSTENCCTLINL